MKIVRTQKEIDRVMDWATEGEMNKSHFIGMKYEEGIIAMFNWLIGEEDSAPDEE